MNNLDVILPILNFSDPEDKFYFIQIFKRRKDNPGMKKDMIVLKSFYIHTKEKLIEKFEEIKKICDDNNARAYIRLNRRSNKQIALQSMVRISTMISMNQYDIRNVYDAICGQFHAEEDKTWIIDIDFIDFKISKNYRESLLDELHESLIELQKEAGREPLMIGIPSKNGFHLITRPFNIKKMDTFRFETGFHFDYHKDNPTILYSYINKEENE